MYISLSHYIFFIEILGTLQQLITFTGNATTFWITDHARDLAAKLFSQRRIRKSQSDIIS